MARKRCAVLVAACITLGCATEIQRTTCSCTLRAEATGVEVCAMDQDARTFKRRPVVERIGGFISSLFGL